MQRSFSEKCQPDDPIMSVFSQSWLQWLFFAFPAIFLTSLHGGRLQRVPVASYEASCKSSTKSKSGAWNSFNLHRWGWQRALVDGRWQCGQHTQYLGHTRCMCFLLWKIFIACMVLVMISNQLPILTLQKDFRFSCYRGVSAEPTSSKSIECFSHLQGECSETTCRTSSVRELMFAMCATCATCACLTLCSSLPPC